VEQDGASSRGRFAWRYSFSCLHSEIRWWADFFFWQARKARRRNIVRQIRNWRRLKLCLSHSLKWREACFNGLKLGCSRRVMWTASTACEVTEKLVTFIVYSEFVTKLEYARRVLWAIRTTSTVGHMYRVQSHWEVHDIHVPRWVRDEIGMLTTSNVSRMYRVQSHREARDIHVLNWVRDEIGMLTTSSVDCMYRVRSHWEAHDIDGLLWVREEIGIRATSDVGCMYRVRSHRVGRDMHVLHWIHDIDVLHYLGRCLAQAMWTVIQTVIQVIIINTKLMLCL